MPEEFSIMKIKHSWYGLMKKINLELFPCKKEETLNKFLKD